MRECGCAAGDAAAVAAGGVYAVGREAAAGGAAVSVRNRDVARVTTATSGGAPSPIPRRDGGGKLAVCRRTAATDAMMPYAYAYDELASRRTGVGLQTATASASRTSRALPTPAG